MSALEAPSRARSAPVQRPRPALRVVPARRRRRAQRRFVLLLAGVLLLAIGAVLVLSSEVDARAFQITSLQARLATATQRLQALEAQEQELAAPATLAARAKALGLVPDAGPVFLELPSGRVLGVPQPAQVPAHSAPVPFGVGA